MKQDGLKIVWQKGITKHDVAHGNEPMSIIDTPGDNSKEEAIKHAILLSESLTH